MDPPSHTLLAGPPHGFPAQQSVNEEIEPELNATGGNMTSKEHNTFESSEPFEVPEEDKYIHGVRLVLMVICLMMGVFTMALDNTIICKSSPSSIHSLIDTEKLLLYQKSPTTLIALTTSAAWYGSVYLLSQMSFQPTFGKMYTFFNIKWIYLGALVLFELGSILCAAAPNSPVFIVGRAVAGLGAAGLFCGGMLIVSQIVEVRKRPLFLGIITSMYGVASVIGPTLGGVFTNSARLTWRFCFWINLPLGGLSALIVCIYYPASSGEAPQRTHTLGQKLGGLGFKSALILTSTLTCLVLGLQWGGAVYPWSDSRVWGCFLGFGLLFTLFGYVQFRMKDKALVPLRILSQRSVLLGCIFSALLQGGMMTQAYHLPFYFQAVKGVNAQESGLDILPHGVTVTLATLISGTLITALGFYVPFMWLGSALFVTGGGLLSTLSRSSVMARWFGFEVLAGFGYGLTVQVSLFAAQVVLNAADLPIGTTLVILFQALGGALGLAISQNVFQNILRQRLREIQGVDVVAVVATGGVDLQNAVPDHLLDLVRDAFKSAVTDAFLVSVGIGGAAFIASLGMERKQIKGKK